jgi:hypothetical protein
LFNAKFVQPVHMQLLIEWLQARNTEKSRRALRAIRWLQDPSLYVRLKLAKTEPPVSDLTPDEAAKLLSADIIETAPRESILLWIIAFPVFEPPPKDRLRPIAWTKDLNEAIWKDFDPQDSTSIPGVPAQKQQILRGKRAAAFDLTSGFHQLLMHADVRPNFGVQSSDGTVFQYKRLPMGFTLSVFVLQSILEAICEDVEQRSGISTLVYVDNIRLVGDSRLGLGISIFKDLCSRFGFTLSDEPLNSPHTKGDHMGIHCDYANGTCCLSSKHQSRFQQYALSVAEAQTFSTLESEVLFGNLFWATEVLCIDPSAYFFAMKWYSRRMSRYGSSPDACFSIWESARRDLMSWIDLIRLNTEVHVSAIPSDPAFTLWTDASLSGFGSVLLHRATGSLAWHSGKWTADEKKLHINVLEMIALHRAVLRFSEAIGSSPVLILIDNTSVKFSLKKRFSPSLPLNEALHDCATALRTLAISEIRYIRSANNFADLPSRGAAPDLTAVEHFILHSASG